LQAHKKGIGLPSEKIVTKDYTGPHFRRQARILAVPFAEIPNLQMEAHVYIHLALAGLVGLLLLLAAYYGWKSVRMLRRTTPQFEMLPHERQFYRRQAWRRLINSCLTLLLAGFMAVPFLTPMQEQAEQLGEERVQMRKEGRVEPMTPEQKKFARFYAGYWITTLLVLALILLMAGVDVFATRHYAFTQMRQIQADRRAMIQRQLERWRQERNGE
jgi:hypothetical protein